MMAMMGYEDYCNEMCAYLEGHFKNIYPGTQAKVMSIQKPNIGERKGIWMHTGEIPDIAPTVYLEPFYQEYLIGEKTFDESCRKLTDIFQREIALMPMREFDLMGTAELAKSWENARDHVTIKAICTSRNQDLLEQVPHLSFGDISVVYHVVNPLGYHANGAIRITNELMAVYGVSVQQLHARALENSMRDHPAICRSMAETMKEIFGIEKDMSPSSSKDEVGLYVLSNKEREFGAATLFYPDVLERIGKQIPEGFYILPSSVHEVMILPKNQMVNIIELNQIVREINALQVKPEEFLSDYVSEYDPLTRKVTWGQAPGMEKQIQEMIPERDQKERSI